MPNATSVWDFSDGQILTAAKLDDVNCGIHVFADSTARTNAYGGTGERTLVEGEFSYLADTNATAYYDGTSWIPLGTKIGQVVATAKTDTFSTTSTTFTDITGLSLSITPSNTASKILILSNIVGVGNLIAVYFQLMRDTTAIGIGDTRGSRSRISGLLSDQSGGSGAFHTGPICLDSPSSTSALTYKVQVRAQAAGTLYINRSITDTDSSGYWTGVSTIVAMEVLP